MSGGGAIVRLGKGKGKTMTNKRYKTILILLATLMISLLVVLLPYFFRHNYLTWNLQDRDGITQHATFLEYYKQGYYLNKIGTFNFQIGLGADHFTSFIYYAFLDPFNVLLFLLPFKSFLLSFSILVFVKFITAGIFMFIYLKHRKISDKIAIIVSVIYMLSGFLIFTLPRHIDLASAVIYLPLIIYGLELVYDNRRPYLFIISSFLCLITCFYIFYMVSVFVVLYSILYYFEKYKKEERSVKHFFKVNIIVALWYLLAIMLASFMLFPLVYSYLHIARGSSKGIKMFNFTYYLSLIGGLFAPINLANYTPFKINIFVILAIIPCFFIKKKNFTYKTLFIIFVIGLFIPLFGYVMNLFNYVNNRWIFLLDFVSLSLLAISLNEKYDVNEFKKPVQQKIVAFDNKKYFVSILFFFTIAYLVIYNSFYSKEFNYNGIQFANLTSSNENIIRNKDDNIFYRTDKEQDDVYRMNYVNTPINNKYNGTYSYNSMSNKYTYEFLKSLGIYNATQTLGISGLNQRIVLESLLSVKYYLQDNNTNIPYEFIKTNNQKIYENNYYLPLGILYENKMQEKDYYKLSYLEKQHALMNSLIVNDDKVSSNYQINNAINNDISYEIVDNPNVKIENNKIKVLKDNTVLKINVTSVSNHELYINLSDIIVDENVYINVKTNNVCYDFQVVKKGEQMYNDIKDYSLLLGYYDSVETVELTISFSNKINKAFGFSFASYDMNSFKKSYDKLNKNNLVLERYNDKEIIGNINALSDGAIFFSIPYSKGFKAYVDGKKTNLYVANIGFMALDITKGNHNIKIVYDTPYLVLGIIVSCVSLAILASYVIYDICRKKRKNSSVSIEKE